MIVVYLYKMALKISFVKYEWLILITELRSRMQSLLNWELRTAFLKPIALHATHNYLNGRRVVPHHETLGAYTNLGYRIWCLFK